MSKEKQTIEEMARDVCDSIVWDQDGYAEVDCLSTAKVLRLKGYCKQEWISVDERLPEESGYYLTYNEGVTSALEYSVRHKLFNATDDLPEAFSKKNSITVSHWMPLPEPPKMKGEKQ